MSIVHVLDKIWVKIAKNFEVRTSGGGVVSDFGHPRTGGGRGVKKEQIFADVLYGWPLMVFQCEHEHSVCSKAYNLVTETWVFHLVQYYGSNVCIHILHIALTAWADKTMKKWLKLAGNYQARA